MSIKGAKKCIFNFLKKDIKMFFKRMLSRANALNTFPCLFVYISRLKESKFISLFQRMGCAQKWDFSSNTRIKQNGFDAFDLYVDFFRVKFEKVATDLKQLLEL